MKRQHKIKALYALFSVLLLWAGVMTFAYWRLAKSSTNYLEAQLSQFSQDDLKSLESAEVTAFLKRLLETQFSYQKDNYLETRKRISLVLAEELRSSFLLEAERLYPKIKERNIHYKGEIKNLILHASGKFGALIEVSLLSENRQKVFYSTTGQWLRTTRSLENPSGIYLKEWSHNQTPFTLTSKDIQLDLTPGIPVLLHFPCALRNTSKNYSSFNMSITTQGDFSEVQLTLQSEMAPEPLTFQCGKTQFAILIKPSSESYYTFVRLHSQEGRRILKVADEYDLVIDKVLGKSGP